MRKFLSFSFAALLIVALCAVSALAQSQANTGQISGSVLDANGAAVPNATVKATNKGTALMREATTSGDESRVPSSAAMVPSRGGAGAAISARNKSSQFMRFT